MPYFTPPGGDVTAAYARSLMGMGLIPPGRYARPSIPTAVVMTRAAQSAATRRALDVARQGGVSLMMSGMGLGIIPSVNVRYTKTAIPAALARRFRAQHASELQGLGRAGAVRPAPARAFDVFSTGGVSLAPIRRQAGFFMGPGGGPGGGPFQFPGFMAPARMSGLGDDAIDTTMIPAGDTLTPPSDSGSAPLFLLPQPSDANVQPSSYTAPTTLTPPAQQALPQLVQQAIPFIRPGQPTQYITPQQAGFFSSSTMGVPNAVLAVGLGAIVLMALRGGRRRRNSSRPRSRRRRS